MKLCLGNVSLKMSSFVFYNSVAFMRTHLVLRAGLNFVSHTRSGETSRIRVHSYWYVGCLYTSAQWPVQRAALTCPRPMCIDVNIQQGQLPRDHGSTSILDLFYNFPIFFIVFIFKVHWLIISRLPGDKQLLITS